MKNYQDGGEAILESFRNLGIKYVISSPGSEWSPVWEALADPNANDIPVYMSTRHEETAIGMARDAPAFRARYSIAVPPLTAVTSPKFRIPTGKTSSAP